MLGIQDQPSTITSTLALTELEMTTEDLTPETASHPRDRGARGTQDLGPPLTIWQALQ